MSLMLPKDPAILLGVVNTKLRDFYSSLDELCEDMQEDKSQIEASLAKIGYNYSPQRNAFI